MLLVQAIRIVSLLAVTVIISPLLISSYLLCWIWATLASVTYGFKKCILLTGIDAVLSTETYSHNSVINTLLLTQDDMSIVALRDTCVDKIVKATDSKNRPLFPKFTRCLILRAGYLMWSEPRNFNIDEHIKSYHGLIPHNEAELKALVNDLCNTPLPPSKPHWQFVVVPLQYTQTDDNNCAPKTCVLIRIHHSIGDGVSLSRILFEILGDDEGAIRQVHKQMDKKFKTKFRNVYMKKLEKLIQIARALFFAPAILWKFQFNNDPRLAPKSKLSGVKIYDWSSSIKLSIIKDIKNATSTTVNDVITSCLAAALRKVFLDRGTCPPQLHCFFVVNLQTPDDPIEAKNHFTFVHSPLPTGQMGCMQRLKTTKAIMDRMKCSPDIMVNLLFVRHMFNIVPFIVTKWFFEKTHQTVLLSNVPGPSNMLHFICSVDGIVALPQIRVLNDFGVLVHSYRDEVTVSVTMDTAIVGHTDSVRLLLKEFVEEIQQLHSSINV